nr:MAG TPA: hypothetical protein [Bacteriophage sp.]
MAYVQVTIIRVSARKRLIDLLRTIILSVY